MYRLFITIFGTFLLMACGKTLPGELPVSKAPTSPPTTAATTGTPHGADSSGGGYAFSETSDKLLDKAVEEAVYDFQCYQCADERFNGVLAKHGLKPVEQKEMLRLIKDVRRNYFDDANRANENGKLEPLMFNFGKDDSGKGFIVALRLFFVANAAFNPNSSSMDTVRDAVERAARQLLHESSHLFGYSEKEARSFAWLLTRDFEFSVELSKACKGDSK